MKTVVLIFVCLGVALSDLCARIGDTEEQVLTKNLGTKIDRDTIDERSKVIVFTNFKEGTQYAIGLLDGKVESEVWTTLNDSRPDKEFVLATIHSYKEIWFPIYCEDDCAAIVSDDGKYFARIGPSKELKKQNVFWVFSDNWKEFAVSKKKNKGINL